MRITEMMVRPNMWIQDNIPSSTRVSPLNYTHTHPGEFRGHFAKYRDVPWNEAIHVINQDGEVVSRIKASELVKRFTVW